MTESASDPTRLPWRVLAHRDGVSFGREADGSDADLQFRRDGIQLPDGQALSWRDTLTVSIELPTTSPRFAVAAAWADLLSVRPSRTPPVWPTVRIQARRRDHVLELERIGRPSWRLGLATCALIDAVEGAWDLLAQPTIWQAVERGAGTVSSRAWWVRNVDVGVSLARVAGYQRCVSIIESAVTTAREDAR